MMEEKGKTLTTEKISKNPIVTIDTKVGDMLKWDAEGRLLDFATAEGAFKDLPVEVMKELSFENKSRYMMAKEIARLEAGSAGDDWKNDLVVTEQYASPTERIEVKNRRDGFEYYLSTPDKMSKHERDGYSVVKPSDPESIGLSGRNTIGTAGREELVLMRTTAENHQRLKKAAQEKRAFRKGAMINHVHEVGAQNQIGTRDFNEE